MTVNSNLEKALRTWENSELTEYNEAPLVVRVFGGAIVSMFIAVALLP